MLFLVRAVPHVTTEGRTPNEFGGDDSVIDLTDLPVSAQPAKPKLKAKPRVARRVKKTEATA
jgi:hypothetical protein